MMSFIRIVLGVLLGVGILAGLAFLGRAFPVAAPRIWCLAMGFGMCGFLSWFVAHCMQLGVTGGRFTRYQRNDHPFHFWSYILFYSLLAAFFFAFGVCSIVAPRLLSLK
jgi:hypothetical protein